LIENILFTNLEYLPPLMIPQKSETHVITLPERLRKALERTVRQLRTRENVYGIGLFGSWSRGQAVPSSDVDLFILDEDNFACEYVERIHAGGFPIDLDHAQKRWIRGQIPPELDQKLYEMQILYDRDWSLATTKLLMSKSYGSAERVEIRTQAHVVEADIYLSRATSAFSRQDFKSSRLFAEVAMENILRVIIEIGLEPFSNSHFVGTLETCATRLGVHDLFEEYVDVTKLSEIDSTRMKDKVHLFETIWNEVNSQVRRDSSTFKASHFKIRTKLDYYLNPYFLQGAVVRTTSMIDDGNPAEASHYLDSILLKIVEYYLSLKSSTENIRTDYSTLMRCLESFEDPKNYRNVLSFFDLEKADAASASRVVNVARRVIVRIRRDRNILIRSILPAS
jgi:predicted nucleotidyltransferase